MSQQNNNMQHINYYKFTLLTTNTIDLVHRKKDGIFSQINLQTVSLTQVQLPRAESRLNLASGVHVKGVYVHLHTENRILSQTAAVTVFN